MLTEKQIKVRIGLRRKARDSYFSDYATPSQIQLFFNSLQGRSCFLNTAKYAAEIKWNEVYKNFNFSPYIDYKYDKKKDDIVPSFDFDGMERVLVKTLISKFGFNKGFPDNINPNRVYKVVGRTEGVDGPGTHFFCNEFPGSVIKNSNHYKENTIAYQIRPKYVIQVGMGQTVVTEQELKRMHDFYEKEVKRNVK